MGHAEIAADGGDGGVDDFGGVFEGEAGEEAEFDDAGLAGVEFFEGVEGGVEGEDVCIRWLGDGELGGFGEGDAEGAVAAFGGLGFAGGLDENAAHESGGDAEEVGAVLPLVGLPFDEAEEGFVDEGGGLEDVAGAFAGEVVLGEGVEFAVDEGGEAGEGVGVALAPGGEDARDVGGSRHRAFIEKV